MTRTATDLTPIEVSQLIHRIARPYMGIEGWCVNAAKITQDVLRQRDIQSWAVHATVVHLNSAYEDVAERWGFQLADGTAEDRYAAELQAAGAWLLIANVEQKGVTDSLPGHVLTWVPSWGYYLDPSAAQFNRPAKNILLEAAAWRADPPPSRTCFRRDDGGLSLIEPTMSRKFRHASAWRRPLGIHRSIAKDIVQEWETMVGSQQGNPTKE